MFTEGIRKREEKIMDENLLIMHGGGPTAVINCSLYGAVTEAKKRLKRGRILAARNGTGGLIREELIDLTEVAEADLKKLLVTPGSAIGTSRDQLNEAEYMRMAEILKRHQIRYVLMNGGNGTMDTCGRLFLACRKQGLEIKVMGIPKTMDNDIAVTDHSPGFPSAARFIAESVREVCADVRGLPIHVSVIEASGRNAGWITAASALAADQGGPGPDLIYLPERPFDEDAFIEDVEGLLKVKKGIVVVASEGLKDASGRPVVEPIFTVGRATYFGDVGAHLANLVIRRLGYKARSEKPGLIGRASIRLQSPVDRREAIVAGALACREVLSGTTGKMVAFRRVCDRPYRAEAFLVDIDQVMMTERTVPDSYINARGNGVTEAFMDWCRPLLGADLPEMISFN